MTFRPFRTIPVIALLTLGACSVLKPVSDTAPAEPARREAPAASAQPRADRALSDANIAAIVLAANNADIAYAEQALAKSRDTDVRQFAQMTKTDHETMNAAAGRLAAKLKLTPADNETSFDLRDDSEEKRGVLRELEGFAFDSAYLANEVSYHTNVLAAIDGALIPSARNAELKALLVQVRPAVAAHLDHAEALVAKKARRR